MKDWIVTIEQKKHKSSTSKGSKKNKNTLDNAVKYLLDSSHKNHFHTSIFDLNDARETRNNIHNAYFEMQEKYAGRGVSNIATSFVLSLPADLYHPTEKEWNSVFNTTMNEFTERLNKDLEKKEKALNAVSDIKISKMSKRQLEEHELNKTRYAVRFDCDTLKSLSTAVVHDDRDKPYIPGKTAGSHLNIVMSNIYDDEVIKIFSQKAGLNAMKKSYNNAIKQHLKLESKKYIPFSARPAEHAENREYFYNDENNHIKTPRPLIEINKDENDNPVYKKTQNIPLWAANVEKNKKTLIDLENREIEIKNREIQFNEFKNKSVEKIKKNHEKVIENHEKVSLKSKENDKKAIENHEKETDLREKDSLFNEKVSNFNEHVKKLANSFSESLQNWLKDFVNKEKINKVVDDFNKIDEESEVFADKLLTTIKISEDTAEIEEKYKISPEIEEKRGRGRGRGGRI